MVKQYLLVITGKKLVVFSPTTSIFSIRVGVNSIFKNLPKIEKRTLALEILTGDKFLHDLSIYLCKV